MFNPANSGCRSRHSERLEQRDDPMSIANPTFLLDKVKEHFQSEARDFDRIIQKLIPYYQEMVQALILAIPFHRTDAIRVLDVGCGTGTIARRVLDVFPSAELTCLDFTENMVAAARRKLSAYSQVRFVVKDFRQFEWSTSYHVVISCLALHHLVTDEDKQAFYRQVYAALKPGGCFYNADIVLASSAHVQEAYLAKWKAYMRRKLSEEKIERTWLPKYRQEDHPAPLWDQLEWLSKLGFKAIDVPWKYYNVAVYGGVKAGLFP